MSTTGIGDEDTEGVEVGPLCSQWARAVGLDPVGTAGCYSGYLLVEWPLPWPRDLAAQPELARVADAARGAGMRLQGLVPHPAAALRHVICYRWPPGGGRFERREVLVEPGDVVDAALGLLGEEPAQEGIIDLLVCTHGRRDRCCGSFGTALAAELASDPGALGPGVRLWRTSHTGGHRFAPTAIVLPEGTLWAFCDATALRRVVGREGPIQDLLRRYRGCSGLASPALQALERAVLAETGWELFDSARSGVEIEPGLFRLFVGGGDGKSVVWQARVRAGEPVAVPACGRPVDDSANTEAQLVVEDLRRVPR